VASPAWTEHLTEDDEWVVRTALANIASDLERVADEAIQTYNAVRPTVSAGPAVRVLKDSAQRYRAALERIEQA
jgi:hypothetical protein